MKKKFFVAIIVSLLVLSLAGCKNKEHNIDEYFLEIPWTEDFKILQLTDLHIGAKDNREREYGIVKKTIEEASPNLIVMTGDVFTLADKTTAKEFFNFMDDLAKEKDFYWTLTWGNHDEQCYFSIDWVTSYLNDLTNSSESKCKFKDIQDDNIQGNANFAINLVENSVIKKQVIIMDSNRYMFNFETQYYDCIKEEQVEWYKKIVDRTTEIAGSVVESLLYFHIPLQEFNKYNDPEATMIIGEKNEGICASDVNTGLFSAIKEKNSTISINCGHDHNNDFIFEYKDVVMCYGVTATDRVYYLEDMVGGTLLTITSDKVTYVNGLKYELLTDIKY